MSSSQTARGKFSRRDEFVSGVRCADDGVVRRVIDEHVDAPVLLQDLPAHPCHFLFPRDVDAVTDAPVPYLSFNSSTRGR
jgi:hypothetical protein